MSNDFRNSTAQLAVDFLTEVVVETNPGDNYMRMAFFIDRNPDYVVDESGFLPIIKNSDGSTKNDMCVLTKNNYSEVCGGRLLTWLTDLFCNQMPFQALLFRFGPAGGIMADSGFTDDVKTELTELANKVKPAAYHKQILVQDTGTTEMLTSVALWFAQWCATDKLLNSKPYYPHRPSTLGDASTDPVWNGLKAVGIPAMMTYHEDNERNGALFQLGQALSGLNSSGTPVGDSIDMVATNLITPSGQPDPDTPNFQYSDWEDYNLSSSVQNAMEAAHISYFRTVGNGTGYVHAVGDVDIMNGVMQAEWIVNFCNYVNKVRVAERITRKNTLRNAKTYSDIIGIMMGTVGRFGPGGSGRLTNIVNSAPAFADLPPSSGREIIVPNAWSADYVFGVRRVTVYGTLSMKF